MSSLLIKNARYLGDSVDLLVVDGKVQSLSASINAPTDAEIMDAAGKILFPSFIDVHTHLREPGYEWKETVATGLSSAAHGGFGAILCMANTDPVNDDAAVTEQILESARRSWPNGPRVHPIGAATVGLKGEELTRMSELKDAGCVAISNDGRPVGNTEIFRRMLEYAADLDLIVIDHCEDPYLAAKSHMNEGVTSGVLGVKGQPDVAETIQASRSILLADYLGVDDNTLVLVNVVTKTAFHDEETVTFTTYTITGEVDDPAVLWTLKNSVAKGEKYEGILTVGEKGTAVLNKTDDSLIEIATEAPKEK